MTITGTFPTDVASQQDYMNTVNQTFKNLEARTSVVTVHGTNEPSDAVKQAQWASQIPFAPPTNGSIINWYNPISKTIQQVYYPNNAGSGVLLPHKPKPTNLGLVYLADFVVGANGILDTTGFTIPTTYRHLLIKYSVRGAGAGTVLETLKMNLNANVTATHMYVGSTQTSAGLHSIFTATAQAFAWVGVVPQNGVTNQAMAAVGQIWIPNYNFTITSAARMYWAWCTSIVNNARPYTKNIYRVGGFLPSVGATNRVQLQSVTSTNFVRGSKMTLYALA